MGVSFLSFVLGFQADFTQRIQGFLHIVEGQQQFVQLALGPSVAVVDVNQFLGRRAGGLVARFSFRGRIEPFRAADFEWTGHVFRFSPFFRLFLELCPGRW